MSPYLLKSLTPVRYLVSLLHSLPFLRSSPASQAGMRYFYIPSEMSCAHKICFDTNTSVSLCCFFHTVTPLHSHNMDTLLLPWPFLSPSTVLFILPPPLPFFNSIVTSPERIAYRCEVLDFLQQIVSPKTTDMLRLPRYLGAYAAEKAGRIGAPVTAPPDRSHSVRRPRSSTG